jgi:hypothetical protein
MDSLGRPGNDACATIAGFVYQVNVTIQHWLKLGPGEHLELEAGEDIDIVRYEAGESETDPEWLTIQLKAVIGLASHAEESEGPGGGGKRLLPRPDLPRLEHQIPVHDHVGYRKRTSVAPARLRDPRMGGHQA